MCMFARLGGDYGMRLSKSAFAVLLKFSDGIAAFKNLIGEVEMIMEEQPEDMPVN